MRPFLKTVITLATFNLSGKTPAPKDSLINLEIWSEMGDTKIFNNLMGILFGPQDSPFFKAWIIEDTSLEEQGEMKKECKFGLLKYDNGYLGVLGIVFVISIMDI